MKAAYEILGYPTYHYISMMENPPDMDIWLSLLEKKYPTASPSSTKNTNSQSSFGESESLTLADFDALLGHVSAVTDIPCNAFSLDLIHLYPLAKVILVEREVESWFQSFNKNVIESFAAPLTRLICLLDPSFVGKQGRIGAILMREQWGATSFQQWRNNARGKYIEHNSMVKAAVPKERLLVYRLGEGWEPLCRFLGREVPVEVEFPRVNETEELKERVFLALMLGVRKAVGRWLVVVSWLVPVVAIAVWWMWKSGM